MVCGTTEFDEENEKFIYMLKQERPLNFSVQDEEKYAKESMMKKGKECAGMEM